MALDPEDIVDRRRMRRKLLFWRFAGFVALAALVVVGLYAWLGEDGAFGGGGSQIARISVSGFIADSRGEAKVLKKLEESDSVKAVLVAIDSTGGATSGGEALYVALRKLAAKKPTVATIDSFGASAAYMAAIATDHIVARRTSITGSIGVFFQYPEIGALLDKVGVDVETIKSGPLKAEPSLFEPTSEEARQVIAGVVDDTFQWFIDIVAERRDLSRPEVTRIADGRIFTGGQALDAGLVDAIGGEEEAIAWLEDERGVAADLPVRDWSLNRAETPFSLSRALLAWIGRQVGLGPNPFGDVLLDGLLPDRLTLDGLLSVWHPPLGQNDAEGAPR
jgi:protease-4